VPDIKLDFSRVTYSNILEIVAPIIPGGILAVGTLVMNPPLAARILANPYLGYRSRLATAIFVSYAAGLLLNLLVSYTSYSIGYMVGYWWGSKLFPDPKPWTFLRWRKMARKFLGPDLAPTTDELYLKDFHNQKLGEANALPDGPEKAAKLKSAEEFFLPKQTADLEWYWWFQILDRYFAPNQSSNASWQYYLSMVHTAAWAVILLMTFNHRYHWFAWVVCTIGVLFGNLSSWFSGGVHSDPYAINQTAMLLRVFKPLSESDMKGEKE
jgi:hypothetical protein